MLFDWNPIEYCNNVDVLWCRIGRISFFSESIARCSGSLAQIERIECGILCMSLIFMLSYLLFSQNDLIVDPNGSNIKLHNEYNFSCIQLYALGWKKPNSE